MQAFGNQMHYSKYERYRRVLGCYRIPGALSINTDPCYMPYCRNGCSITEMRGDWQHWAEKGVLVAYISEKGRCICTGRFAMVSPDFFQRFTLSLTLRKKTAVRPICGKLP